MKVYNEDLTKILTDYDLNIGYLAEKDFYNEHIYIYKLYTEKELNQIEMQKLKQQLADMDYKTSKYADGEYTEEEWAEIVAERKAIRERIRELEKLI